MDRVLYSIREFRELTGIGRTQIYELLKHGDLEAVKVGKRTFITAAQVEAWVKHLPKYRPTGATREGETAAGKEGSKGNVTDTESQPISASHEEELVAGKEGSTDNVPDTENQDE